MEIGIVASHQKKHNTKLIWFSIAVFHEVLITFCLKKSDETINNCAQYWTYIWCSIYIMWFGNCGVRLMKLENCFREFGMDYVQFEDIHTTVELSRIFFFRKSPIFPWPTKTSFSFLGIRSKFCPNIHMQDSAIHQISKFKSTKQKKSSDSLIFLQNI